MLFFLILKAKKCKDYAKKHIIFVKQKQATPTTPTSWKQLETAALEFESPNFYCLIAPLFWFL
jgi:hypothetical protein